MDSFTTVSKILTDITLEKVDFLVQVLNISENQRNILKSDFLLEDKNKLFMEMNVEKQDAIKAINELDTVFDNLYRKTTHFFEDKEVLRRHKEEVDELQQAVQRALFTDEEIRVIEDENVKLVKTHASNVKSSSGGEEPYIQKAIEAVEKASKKAMTSMRVEPVISNEILRGIEKPKVNKIGLLGKYKNSTKKSDKEKKVKNKKKEKKE